MEEKTMKKYTILIEERYLNGIEVEAEDDEQAEKMAIEKYNTEDIGIWTHDSTFVCVECHDEETSTNWHEI